VVSLHAALRLQSGVLWVREAACSVAALASRPSQSLFVAVLFVAASAPLLVAQASPGYAPCSPAWS